MKHGLTILKTGKLLSLSFIICHLSFSVSACSSIDCPVQNTVAVQYAICNSLGEHTTLTDTLWVWTQRSDGTDTLLLNRLVGKDAFSLPVSYVHPEDMLVLLRYSPQSDYSLDTLWIKKDDIPHFESVDCAAHFFHRITDVRYTHDGIDSVVVKTPTVDYNQSKTHINIYFSSF